MNKNISDGVQKLYNCLAKGWGNVLIPQEVRGILDKEVRQINASEEEEKNLYDVIELYGDNKQSVAEVRKLYLRTCSRVLSQEMRKQENIENVISKAQEILQDENNVEKEKKKEIWNYLLENSRISSTWKNFESYYNEFGITTEMSVWINENCSDIVKSEKTEKIDNDCIKSIIINSEITVQTVEQIADNYKCDEEIEFDVSKLPEDKIYVLIRKHYIRYSLSNTEKIKSNAIDGFGIYCREYIDQFINDLPSVSLNESEVVILLNDTTIDKHFKPEILKKISAGIMTKKLAQTIASNQFDVDKVYVERAWKFLDNTERHMLLVYHLQVYSVAEISRLLMELGGEWSKLSDNKSRHKEEISIDVNGHNERLLLQLQKKGFITSYQEKNDRKKRCFEVWVKQQ